MAYSHRKWRQIMSRTADCRKSEFFSRLLIRQDVIAGTRQTLEVLQTSGTNWTAYKRPSVDRYFP
jgi:flagellar biosynthesis/type III secretory pathway chaperone